MSLGHWLFLHLVLGMAVFMLLRAIYGPGNFPWTDRLNLNPATKPGTARWLTWGEAQKIFATSYDDQGLLLGTLKNTPIILPRTNPGNRNITLIGPPGSMKSRAYIRNNMFQAVHNETSVIITDPKGELTRDFKTFFEANGYIVKIFNLVDMLRSDRWNPFNEIQTDQDVQIFAQTIINNTSSPHPKGDDFWDRAEMNLLEAVLYFIKYEAGERRPDLGKDMESVYKIITSGDIDVIEKIFKPLEAEHPARYPFALFKSANSTIQSGVVNGMGTRLKVFQSRVVRELTRESDIDLETLGQQKSAYFCIIPDTDQTYSFLSSLFFAFAFIKLMRLADKSPGGELPVEVLALLDEFCNIGMIPDFLVKLSTMRSRGIACTMAIQSLVQLQLLYDRSFEIILANSASWLILGANDNTTAKYISEKIGSTSITGKSHRRHALNIFDGGQISIKDERRPLIHPDEIGRLPNNEAILIYQGTYPLRLEKLDYTRHPSYGQLRPIEIAELKPEWAVQWDNPDNHHRITARVKTMAEQGEAVTSGEGSRQAQMPGSGSHGNRESNRERPASGPAQQRKTRTAKGPGGGVILQQDRLFESGSGEDIKVGIGQRPRKPQPDNPRQW